MKEEGGPSDSSRDPFIKRADPLLTLSLSPSLLGPPVVLGSRSMQATIRVRDGKKLVHEGIKVEFVRLFPPSPPVLLPIPAFLLLSLLIRRLTGALHGSLS